MSTSSVRLWSIFTLLTFVFMDFLTAKAVGMITHGLTRREKMKKKPVLRLVRHDDRQGDQEAAGRIERVPSEDEHPRTDRRLCDAHGGADDIRRVLDILGDIRRGESREGGESVGQLPTVSVHLRDTETGRDATEQIAGVDERVHHDRHDVGVVRDVLGTEDDRHGVYTDLTREGGIRRGRLGEIIGTHVTDQTPCEGLLQDINHSLGFPCFFRIFRVRKRTPIATPPSSTHVIATYR